MLAQRNAQLEIVVVDDASSDGSPEALRQYGDAIRLLCLEKNVGACAARNQGAALATGEYLVFLDGDDALLPWALQVYERVVQEKKPELILARMQWFEGTKPEAGETPTDISFVEYGDYFRRDRGFGHSASAMVVTRRSFEQVGGWLVGFFPLEDVEFALRLGVAGKTVQVLSPQTILHRAHNKNTVNDVGSFMPLMAEMIAREQRGIYPGGAKRRFERRALVGGIAAHWIRRAGKSGLRSAAIKLFGRSWEMLLANGVKKLKGAMGGKQAAEKIKI